MYINIKGRLFKKDPCIRFATYFKCHPDVWREVWHKYKILDYTKTQAKEYLIITLKRPVDNKCFNRWIDRTEIYIKAQIAVNKGAKQVDSQYFGKYKDFVEKELTKNKTPQ